MSNISEKKQNLLKNKMKDLKIFENDIEEKFILGSGSGGQKVNKSSTCVYLHHLPSKIEVKCQKSRSREENRYLARKILCEKIETQIFKIKTKKLKELEKIKKQKKRRSRKLQKKTYRRKEKTFG